MLKFAANLSLLFQEYAFLDRFEAAAASGFTAVEYHFPYAFAADCLRRELIRNGLNQVLFNFPFLFQWLHAIGYAGWIGCEYIPAGRTEDGLGWMKHLRNG